ATIALGDFEGLGRVFVVGHERKQRDFVVGCEPAHQSVETSLRAEIGRARQIRRHEQDLHRSAPIPRRARELSPRRRPGFTPVGSLVYMPCRFNTASTINAPAPSAIAAPQTDKSPSVTDADAG